MQRSYGPWATAIDSGANLNLSAFWRQRLTQLVAMRRVGLRLTVGSRCGLALAGLLLAVVPTLSFGHGQASEKARPPTAAQTRTRADGRSFERQADGLLAWADRPDSSPPPFADFNQLLAEKKYKLLETIEDAQGDPSYVYRFTRSPGDSNGLTVDIPLEKVSSWNDYQRQVEAQQQRRHERINEAIAAGRFRLLDLSVIQVHRCRDRASGQEFKIQRIQLRDGRELALPQDDAAPAPPAVRETSWKEHLQAIRDGQRELLGMDTYKSYSYQMIANDGVKLLFNYCGGDPLKKPDDLGKQTGKD